MYRVLRNTHLFLGITAMLFVLMYGVSSVQMAFRWFSDEPQVTESRARIPETVADDPRAISRELSLRGELSNVEKTEAGYKFQVHRPGTVYEIDYQRSSREAKVRTETGGFMVMLNRIHHIAGTWHEYSLINVWGVLLGLVSGALLVLGATGIYLWFRIHSERLIGAVLLAVNLGICITLLVLVRTA
jgi:hypothetical protein